MAQATLNWMGRPIRWLGEVTYMTLDFIGGAVLMLGQAGWALPESLFRRPGRRLGWRNLWQQMYRVGVKSLGLITLVQFAMGVILVLQVAPVLMRYGAESRTAKFVTVGLFRETGPLIAAIVLTGFAGASITAELATMSVNSEIAALRSQAIHATSYLVVPRLVATTIMTFCLVILSDLIGLIAASLTAWATMGSKPTFYFFHAFEVGEITDFYTGLSKALVFGLVIGAIACRIGIQASGSARDVGQATTRTVVTTVVALILVDLVFTAAFFGAGLLGI